MTEYTRPSLTSRQAGPLRAAAEVDRVTCPTWASGRDDDEMWSDGLRMLTDDGRVLDDVE